MEPGLLSVKINRFDFKPLRRTGVGDGSGTAVFAGAFMGG
jgi:hypothetical protein